MSRTSSRSRRLAVEPLEDRVLPTAWLDPDIIVGRVPSEWTTGTQRVITFTAYNPRPEPLTNVLLTDALEPGVTFVESSRSLDRNGRELAWSLGTIPAFGRSSVTLTVSVSSPAILQLDSGAKAFATRDAGMVSDDAPALTLRSSLADPSLLETTPDADSDDPVIQQKAAELDYDPVQIYSFLQNEIGYNSYFGSVRGSRGTLWSASGNSLDVASLGIALMRSSGIPSRYAEGTLPGHIARSLILSMTPVSPQIVGAIPAGTPISTPENDPALLAETMTHHWFQFDTGSGFTDAEPLFDNIASGVPLILPTRFFSEVPDELREKTRITLEAEFFSQAESAFGSPALQTRIVLDHTFNDVELVGRPVTLGHFVSSNAVGGLAFSTITHTYSPYLVLGDDADPAPSDDLIRGDDFQEVLTNFPLGSQVLTGLSLRFELFGPQGPAETYTSVIVDRIGIAARRASSGFQLAPIGQDDPPVISPFDFTTASVLSGGRPASSLGVPQSASGDADELRTFAEQYQAATEDERETLEQKARAVIQNTLIGVGRSTISSFEVQASAVTTITSRATGVAAYFARPRITLSTSRLKAEEEGGETTLRLGFDLLKSELRVIAGSGQSSAAIYAFEAARGFAEDEIEGSVFAAVEEASSDLVSSPVFAGRVLDAAEEQGIPVLAIDTSNFVELDALPYDAEAKARLSAAIERGLIVLVPARSPVVNGAEQAAWFEMNPESGQTVGLLRDGTHGLLAEFVSFVNLAENYTQFQAGFAAGLFVGTAGAIWGAFTDLLQSPMESLFFADGIYTTAKSDLQKGAISFFQTSVGIALGSGIRKPLFYAGLYAGTLAVVQLIRLMDPPEPEFLVDIRPTHTPHYASADIAVQGSLPTGAVSGTTTVPVFEVAGDLRVQWQSNAVSSFTVTSLSANVATVFDANGNSLGTGPVTLSAGDAVQSAVEGNATFDISGTGSLAFHGPAASTLAVGGQWENYSGTIAGSGRFRLSTSRLQLNGQPLPAGAYSIAAGSIALTGLGSTATPTFSGSAAIAVEAGTVYLPPGSGTLGSNATSFGGYSGSVTIAPNSDGTITTSLNGSSTAVVTLAAPSVTTDQATAAVVHPVVGSSFAGAFTLSAEAPPGWAVHVDADGAIRVTPKPGANPGSYPLRIVARSVSDPARVVQTRSTVTVTDAPWVVNVSVDPDPLITVPHAGAELPTAFLVTVENQSPFNRDVRFEVLDIPSGFTARMSTTAFPLPAWQTGRIGLYLEPTGAIPAPGSQFTFSIASNMLAEPLPVSFTVPAVHAVTIAGSLDSITISPGTPITNFLTIVNAGNVPETIALEAESSSGLSVDGLVTLTLAPGASATVPLRLTPSASVPLNSYLQARVHARFGPPDGPQTATLGLIVHTSIPGLNGISRAIAAARRLGQDGLASRLADLAPALTNLVLNPGTAVYRAQVTSTLGAITELFELDPYLPPLVQAFDSDRTAIAGSGDPGSAIAGLGERLNLLADILESEVAHGVVLRLEPNQGVARPNVPVLFPLFLQNTGLQPTTYDLGVSGLPAGVSASFNRSSVTLQPGETLYGGPAGAVLTLSDSGESSPAGFVVTATARDATGIIRSATGSLTVRDAFVQIGVVTPTPSFTEPGGTVQILARVNTITGERIDTTMSYRVIDSNGATVYASPPINVPLSQYSRSFTLDFGTFDTTGLPRGAYTLEAVALDPAGNPLTGMPGRGFMQIGTPIAASLRPDRTHSVVSDGYPQSIYHTLRLDTSEAFASPAALLGQASTLSPGSSFAVSGSIGYVGGTHEVNIIDLANPGQPTLVGSFANGSVAPGSFNLVRTSGDLLLVLSQNQVNSNAFDLLAFSISDPLNPVLVSNTRFDYSFVSDLVIDGTTAYVTLSGVSYTFGVFLSDQYGDVLTIDIADPVHPQLTDVLLNTRGAPHGGDHNVNSIISAAPEVRYVASTTAAGGDPSGEGLLLVVDSSGASPIVIPGTSQILDFAIEGGRMLAIGTSGGWAGRAIGGLPDAGYTGFLTLTLFDVTDALHPEVLGSTVQTRNTFFSVGDNLFIGKPSVVPLGSGRYAISDTRLGNDPVLLFVDASDPNAIFAGSLVTPSPVNELALVAGTLLAAGHDGVLAYQVGDIEGMPVRIAVRLPSAGVEYDLASFSTPPSEIVHDPSGATLVWSTTFGAGATSWITEWRTVLSPFEYGEARDVTSGTSINFISQGTPGLIDLPATTLDAIDDPTILVNPIDRTVRPGETAEYTILLSNWLSQDTEFHMEVLGVPADWVTLPNSTVHVPARSQIQLPLQIRPRLSTEVGNYGVTVFATEAGRLFASQVGLAVVGEPVTMDPVSHAILLELIPGEVSVRAGGEARYIIRLTNAGNEVERVTLHASDFPPGVTAVFGESEVEVSPGRGNFRDVPLRLIVADGMPAGAIPFAAMAVAGSATADAAGTLNILEAGVRISLDRNSGVPGESFQVTVINSGSTTETFRLAISGPAALVATLGQSLVTLSPGQSRIVTILTNPASFAARGALGFTVSAVAQSDTAVVDRASVELFVSATYGLVTHFEPATRTIASPGSEEFRLVVENAGNTEDAYMATITSMTGGIIASFIDIDGQATGAVSLFRLPGLSTGTLVVRVLATSFGSGTATILVQSLNDASRAATATAMLSVNAVQPPTAAPQSTSTDSPDSVVIMLAGTDSNMPSRPLTFAITSHPQHGTLGTLAGNAVTYTPNAGYIGPDAFSFTVNNGLASPPALVSIHVRPPRPVVLGYHEFGVGAGAGHSSIARFFNPDGSERFARTVFPSLTGGVRITSADFNGDGIADLVAGTGSGSITHVIVFDGVTNQPLFSIQPFEDGFTGGVFVSAGDVTGDGIPDLVITPDETGGPRVRVFDGSNFVCIADFFGIDDPNFRGGARAAVGDVDGDGVGDIVVSAGFGGGPRIAGFNGKELKQGRLTRLFQDYFHFEPDLRNGAYVAVGDVDGDGFADVIGGGGPGGGPRVFGLSGRDLTNGTQPAVVANFFGGEVRNRGGIRVVARDLDGDRRADLVVGDGAGAGSRVTGYFGSTIATSGTPPEAFAFDSFPGFTGGVYVG